MVFALNFRGDSRDSLRFASFTPCGGGYGAPYFKQFSHQAAFMHGSFTPNSLYDRYLGH